jgi:hypothetical protein
MDLWEGGWICTTEDQKPANQPRNMETKVHIFISTWNFLCWVSLSLAWMGKEVYKD